MDTDLQRMADACKKAAEFYCTNPGRAGAETVIDIYRAMAALASMMDDALRRSEQPTLRQKKLH